MGEQNASGLNEEPIMSPEEWQESLRSEIVAMLDRHELVPLQAVERVFHQVLDGQIKEKISEGGLDIFSGYGCRALMKETLVRLRRMGEEHHG